MGTIVTTRQQELAERLLQMNQAKVLDQIEELLVRAEMQVRADEALAQYERGEGITMEEFNTNAKQWVQARSTK
jgi:hypothetical protein